ncbi:hypothetical protein UFOVP909_220 [uncultured Caudovirales phage]|uniref:Cytidyltransferase-like domain-containing protein n=1 Tax=uncultured Caudovirales phage TaxID=2100421 RepID=A0A6J5SCQ4_9CAUD|nr:hypothetical protein UFOVP909_220 [uncultured Caudovirales phage]CAB4181679.1 hypothetical protein UFOVP1066_51 [uncultured Caudovirales phage]CAB4198300.1 hypothetical protein UFOVP1315_64 [uncultured Caudovirales phage]CAB4211360.1 hypothetical protein UFOVP1421_25 [uncultured Caudovirales phage]CAB5238360.1 hypothetical protein UFOVP1525_35 [uncultured Caudovirales phage]
MDRMKDYRQLIKELPSTTLVCAFGDFDPPTSAHELMVKTVNRLSEQKNTDHVIYASTKDSLIQEEKKEQYLKLMFPKTNFKSVNESKINNLLEDLGKKYKKIVIVTGSEQVEKLKKLVKENTSIQIIPITEKNPDANFAKMKQLATKGLYEEFKKKLPSNIRELDGRRLMNDVRMGLGLEPVKEQLLLVKDKLREQYFRGEIFKEGDIVESNGELYKIVKRGSNHLLLKEQSGNLVSKWIQDVKPTEEKEDMNEELTDKTLRPTDKIKVARIIATMLGVDNAETSSNPENLINLALRKVRTKALNPEALHILDKMLNLATEQGIKYDATLKPSKLKEGVIQVNGTDKLEPSTSDTGAKQDITKPTGKTKGFLTFYNYNMKESHLTDEDDTEKLNTYNPSEVGHTLVSGIAHHVRHMKVKYQTEDVDQVAKERMKAQLALKHAKEKETLAAKHTQEKENINELSTDLLARYKTASAASAKSADASGDYAKGDKRFKGINKATTKQFDNDLKKHGQMKEELDEEHIVHVDDGSKYGEEPHDKDVEHVMSGAKTHGGEFDGHSDKGAFFKFKSHSDAKNFVDHVKRSPHKTVGADLHEEAELEESRGHKIIATKLKNIETARKAFSGEKAVCPKCGKHECACGEQRPGVGTDSTMSKDPFFKEEFTDQDIDEMINDVTDEDIEDLYEEDEVVLVYDGDGEEIPPLQEEAKYDLMEVLSRTERMKGKMRLRKTSAKRGRSTKIALKRFSNPATINKRARRLAIKLMKKRMLRGRDPAKVSIGEKERIEKMMATRKDIISRVAQKLVSRVRKVEKSRMSHGKVTKGAMPSVF